jgi:predicted nucleic acid-binding protein
MNHFYLDASALAKRYVLEIGTPLVNHLFDSAPKARMIALVLALGEVVSILVRRRNSGRIPDHAYRQALVEFSSEVIDDVDFSLHSVPDDLVRTSLPLIERHSLNATDALILRSALDVAQSLRAAGDDLVMISSDIRLVSAAQASGLIAWNPEVNDQAELDALI